MKQCFSFQKSKLTQFPEWSFVLFHLFSVSMISCCTLVVSGEDLVVQIHPLPQNGRIVFMLYHSPSSFAELIQPEKQDVFFPQDGPMFIVSDLTPGDYALLVYVDENHNDILDRNIIGIPSEPIAFSNQYRPKGPPRFDQARFTIAEGTDHFMSLSLTKPLGTRGRWGFGMGLIATGHLYRESSPVHYQFIPAISYIGERIQLLGPMLQMTLLGNEHYRFVAASRFRFGAYDENDSPILRGLGDRRDTIMSGIGLVYHLPGDVKGLLRYEFDILDRIGGDLWQMELSKSFQWTKIAISPVMQMNWSSARLSQYDFGVPSEKALPNRPAYQLSESITYEIGLNTRITFGDNWILMAMVREEILDDTIAKSPIIQKKYHLKSLISLSYSF